MRHEPLCRYSNRAGERRRGISYVAHREPAANSKRSAIGIACKNSSARSVRIRTGGGVARLIHRVFLLFWSEYSCALGTPDTRYTIREPPSSRSRFSISDKKLRSTTLESKTDAKQTEHRKWAIARHPMLCYAMLCYAVQFETKHGSVTVEHFAYSFTYMHCEAFLQCNFSTASRTANCELRTATRHFLLIKATRIDGAPLMP